MSASASKKQSEMYNSNISINEHKIAIVIFQEQKSMKKKRLEWLFIVVRRLGVKNGDGKKSTIRQEETFPTQKLHVP